MVGHGHARTHTHTHTHANAPTHANTHTHTHAHTHTHTHTHTRARPTTASTRVVLRTKVCAHRQPAQIACGPAAAATAAGTAGADGP